MALCAHFEVANALYNWEGDSEDDRIRMRHFLIRNRKRGRELIDWISYRHIFKRGQDELSFKDNIYWPYAGKVAYLTYLYRTKTDEQNSRNPATAPVVLTTLRQCFKHDSMIELSLQFEHLMKEGLKQDAQTFAWTGPSISVTEDETFTRYEFGRYLIPYGCF